MCLQTKLRETTEEDERAQREIAVLREREEDKGYGWIDASLSFL